MSVCVYTCMRVCARMCVCMRMCVIVAQPCLTLCHPMDCSRLGSSVHGILQARILEWVAIPFSKCVCMHVCLCIGICVCMCV